MTASVDVIILSPELEALPPRVTASLRQQNVALHIHRVLGSPLHSDASRWETIARARNEGKQKGRAPWIMFLDDDVVLHPGTIGRLLTALTRWPGFGAVAADYLGEGQSRIHCPHVAMGATLFRRSALDQIRFRCTPARCECQCCCDDLRALGISIGYVPTAGAEHLQVGRPQNGHCEVAVESSLATNFHKKDAEPRIITAFDGNHFDRFRRVFLTSLRSCGNYETVIALGYGLSRGQQRILEREDDVELLSIPNNGVTPCIRRLEGFQVAIQNIGLDTPVAYWDAGDVKFQESIGPLWQSVRENPNKLLVVHEPTSHPENRAVAEWTLSISNPRHREEAFRLLSQNPFLNAGFAAGTASVLRNYLREAQRMYASGRIEGTTDWGDQTIFNMYCHSNPTRWAAISNGWNFCLCHRQFGRDYRASPSDGKGRFWVRDRFDQVIPVVHGNAGSLERLVSKIELAAAGHRRASSVVGNSSPPSNAHEITSPFVSYSEVSRFWVRGRGLR